jgi:hypothetical protein
MKPHHMRNLLLASFLSLVALTGVAQTYTPSAHVQVNDAVAPAQATPLEARSMYFDGTNFVYRAFQSTSEVLSYLNTTASRTGNFIIIVDSGGTLQSNGTYLNPHNTYYMFADSTTSGQLKKLNLFGAGIGTCTGCLLVANNLSDLASLSQALINLNLNNVNNTSDATKNAATVSLTNHTIDGTLNTLLNIPNSALANTTIGLTLHNTGATPQVTTTPASLGGSLVITVPWTNGSDSGFLKGSDWTFFDGKLDTVHISGDSVFNCTNGTCTLAGIINTAIGSVNSVSGTNTSLLFSPTTGNVLGQVNPAYNFVWTGQHTFTAFAPIFQTLTNNSGIFYGNTTGQLLQSGGGSNGQIFESKGPGNPPLFFTPDASTVEGWLGFVPAAPAGNNGNVQLREPSGFYASNQFTVDTTLGSATLTFRGAANIGGNGVGTILSLGTDTTTVPRFSIIGVSSSPPGSQSWDFVVDGSANLRLNESVSGVTVLNFNPGYLGAPFLQLHGPEEVMGTITADTGFLYPPRYTATALAGITGMTDGAVVVDTTNNYLNLYYGGAWHPVGGSDGIVLPTVTGILNVSVATADSAMYTRTRNTVDVDGVVLITPTSGSTNLVFTVSLPINSLLSGGHACWGECTTSQTTNGFLAGVVSGYTSGSNAVLINIGPTGATSAIGVHYHYKYRVQ